MKPAEILLCLITVLGLGLGACSSGQDNLKDGEFTVLHCRYTSNGKTSQQIPLSVPLHYSLGEYYWFEYYGRGSYKPGINERCTTYIARYPYT